MLIQAPITEERLLRVAQEFPVATQIMAELAPLLRDPDTDLADIATVLKRDMSLVSQLIRIANSAALAQSEPVATVENAVACIGCREVYRIVGLAALAKVPDTGLKLYGIDADRLRDNALLTALIMEEMGEPAGEDPRIAYTIGLLRPIGRIVLDRLAPDAGAPGGWNPDQAPDLHAWELDHFGRSNPEVAEIVLQNWHFPHETRAAIRHHLAPAGRHLPLTHLLHLAAALAEKGGYGLPGETGAWTMAEETFAKAGLTEDNALRAAQYALVGFERLRRRMAL